VTQDLTTTDELAEADARSGAKRVGSWLAAARAVARAAVEAAERAFPGWSATPPVERRRLLEGASELLVEAIALLFRDDEITRLLCQQTSF
jgi:betaine-aldehyde dehydrogenase